MAGDDAAAAHDPLSPRVALCLLAGVTVFAAVVRYRFLASSPYPLGIDGYFYPAQLRSLLETGSLRFPAAPVTLWLMAPLAAVVGEIQAVKIGASVGTALACVPVYFLAVRLTGRRGAGLLAAVLIATSPGSFFLSTEFVKNGIGMTLAAGYLCLAYRVVDRPSPGRIAAAVAGLAAVWLSHKLAFAVAVVVSVPVLWTVLEGVSATVRRRGLVGAGLFALAVLAAGLVFPARLVSPGDLTLAHSAFVSSGDWTVPVLDAGGESLRFRNEVAIAAALALGVVAVLAVPRFRRQLPDPLSRRIAAATAVLVLVAALPWLDIGSPQGLGFRLRLIVFLPGALLGALLARAVTAGLRPVAASSVLAGLAGFLVVVRPAVYAEPVVYAHPALVDAVSRIPGTVPAGMVLVVPDRQIMFMVAWYTDVPISLRPESVEPARRWRGFPLGLMDEHLRRALADARRDPPAGIAPPISVHRDDPDGLVVMSEEMWQWLLARMAPGPRQHYERWPTT